jgi:hypothetical protein
MANAKTAIKRLKNALDKKYEVSQPAPVAGAVGDGRLFIDGQLYNGAIAGVTQVVNVGRPAAAQYAAKTGGGVIVQSGGGSAVSAGSGSGPDVTALSLLTVVGEAALTNDRYLDVSTALTKTDGGAGGALTIGMATPGGLSVSSTNVATGNHTHAIASSSAPGAAASILASSAAGLLTLPNFTATTGVRTPLIDTASGGLTISPANNTTTINGSVTMQRSGTLVSASLFAVGDTGSIYPRLAMHRARNVLGSETGVVSGDILGAVSFRGHDGTAYPTASNAEIRAVASENFTTTAEGTNLRFFTTASGTVTLSERLRIHNSGNVSILNTTDNGFALDVTGTARASTSLTTPLLTTATNVDLVINPAGTGAVQFPNNQTLRTSTFDGWAIPYTTGFQINEFAPVPGGSASVLTIGRIQADELNVRVFVANETRVDRGDEFWTKSFGIVALGFTTPASIGGTVSVKFENSPALAGAIFANNDWLLIRKLEIDSGLSLFNVWGQVATYVNNGDGTQNWTFTLRGGPTSKLIEKGSLGIDFGQAGAGLIHLSVVDASGSPYIKLRKWVSGSDPMTINGPNFKTYVQIGNLDSVSNSYYTPSGYGLYVQSANDDSRFIVADDNGLQIRGASFKMYNSTLQTVDISATNGSIKLGTDISSAATTSFDFNGSTGDLAITGDLYTGKVYLLRASGLNTEQDVWGSWDNRRALQWWPNLTNMTGDPSLSMYTGKHSGGSFPNQNWAYIDSNPTGGVLASLSVTAHGQGTGTDATIYLEGGSQSLASTSAVTIIATDIDLVAAVAVTGSLSVGGTAVSLDGHTHSYLPLSGGTLTGTLTSRAITPNADNTHDLGASGARWQDVYAVNLHVGTIVGTPSYSHSHAASDITSGTLDFARIPTTWTGALTLDADSAGTSNYVRWLTQTSTGKAWDLIGRAHDFATAAQQNDMLLTYYDGTTTHIAFQADSATRVIDFGQTPTVSGTAVVLTSRTVSAGSGLTGGGALSGNITISHDDTSSQASVNNSGMTFIQDVTLDTYGHVTALTSTDVSTVLTGYLKADGTVDGATSQAQTFTNGVRTGNGTALVPAFSFSASDSTGIYRQAVDSLSIATVGTERLRVNASGQMSINGAPITGYVVTARPATGQTGGMTLEGTYASAGFLFNTSAILRHAADTTIQAMRWVPTEEPQGAITTFVNMNNNLRLDNSAFNVTNVRLVQGQLLSQAGYTGAITSLSMFHALNASLGGATLTNQYGYYCAALSGATNNFAFYSLGSTPSSFGGTVYIGGDAEVTGDVLVGSGSASLPSIAALSDTNTGLYWSAADTLAVTTGGAQRATFSSGGVTVAGALTVPTINTASGNLTLTPAGGTVAVSAALTVGTTATITGVTSIASGSVGAPGLTFTGDTNTGLYRSGVDAYSLVAGGAAIVNVGATGAGVNAAYDNTAALKVQSVANDDITLFLKQKSGQTARMWRVEDSAGQELIVLDSQGNLQSGNPGFVSGLTGWQITPIGNAELNNAFIRGELHASIFVMDEFHASGGTLYIAPAGKLELDATVYTTTGIEAVFDIRTTSVSGSGSQFDIRTTSGSGSGSQFTWRTIENYFEITDPPSGHAMILSPGDIVRCKALGLSVGIDLWDVWGVVGRVEDMTDYYRYYYERKSGGADGLVIPAGTAIISYGAPGDGRIYLTADQNYAPYMQVFLSGAEPWNGQITPTVRIGRLDGVGLPGVSGIEQHGIVLSSDLSNASAPYLVASNLQMFQYKIDSEWNNGNPTARITADGAMKLGTDIDSASTTGFDFNPATGALTIGSASYPGTVTVYGSITVTGGSGYGNFSDKPTSLSGINTTEGTKLNAGLDTNGSLITKVLPGSTIGTPAGAGLFLGSDRMGYYNGSRWLTHMDNTGAFTFSSATAAKIAWDGTDLYGTDGTNVQWYARASTGKLYAGSGTVVLDRTGILVANSGTSAGITLHRNDTFSSSTKSGRLWALSDLSPARVYFSAGRSISEDGDASNATGIMDIVAYNSSGVAAAMLSLRGDSGATTVTGDLDMNGNDIIDANNCWAMRSTAAL